MRHDRADIPNRNRRAVPGDRGEVRVPAAVRVLLPAAQALAGFLVALPFTDGFDRLTGRARGIYVAALVAALNGVILLAVPVIERCLARRAPRPRPGRYIPRMVTAGRIALASATILTVDVVAGAAGGEGLGIAAALIAAGVIGLTATSAPPGAHDDPWPP